MGTLFKSPSRIIQAAIAKAINTEYELVLNSREIVLEICYPKYGVHYTSAIALAIAHRLDIDAMLIGKKIVENCSQPLEIAAQWQIKLWDKGLLNICLSEIYLSDSLDILMSWHLEEKTFEISGDQPNLWQKRNIFINPANQAPEPIPQYAHARCCALIRLSNIYIEDPLHHQTIDKIELIEPAEISLLLQNLAIADYLENENTLPLSRTVSKQVNRQKLSRSLAEAFLQFYDCCRIFGVDCYAVQRRLLLLRVTQKFLVAIAPPEVHYAIYL